MFISVVLPAPFSPSSACTSLRRRSRSMWSFATVPGKTFVIPRSSRTAGAAASDIAAILRGWAVHTPVNRLTRLELVDRLHLDLAGRDRLADGDRLGHVRLRDLRADRTETDAAVLEVERVVAACLQRAVLCERGQVLDRLVDPLQRAGHHVRTEV